MYIDLADSGSARRSRNFVRKQACVVHGANITEDMELMASEMVTNAVMHGDLPVVIELDCTGVDQALLSVKDEGPTFPVIQAPGSGSEHGRGMQLIEAVSSNWGYEECDSGKRVWATIGGDRPRA